jgi:DnaJ homolog subfamily C member 28
VSGWMSIIDKQIQKAIEEGQMSNLPGEGKPLVLEDDSHTPPELRLAFKMLRDNGFAPDWMMMGQELDSRRESLLEKIKKGVRVYLGALGDAERDSQEGEQRRRRAQSAWELVHKTLQEASQAFNKEIITYNLKIPQGITHKPQINLEQEIKQLLR